MSLNFTKLPYVDGETVIPASNLNAIQDAILDLDSNKVEKEQGKGLSTNDYSNEDKTKVNTALQPSVLENYRTASAQDVIDDAQNAEIADLKSATSYSFGELLTSNLIKGQYYDLSEDRTEFNPISLEDYESAVIPCSFGDLVYVEARGQNKPRAYGFVALNGTILAKATAGQYVREFIKAPENTAFLIVNNYYTYPTTAVIAKVNPLYPVLTKAAAKSITNDFNDYKTRGSFYFADIRDSLHAPANPAVRLSGILYVLSASSKNDITQLFVSEAGRVYSRAYYRNYNTWDTWTGFVAGYDSRPSFARRNAIACVNQMCNIEWTPLLPIPVTNGAGYVNAGVKCKGLPYSSTRSVCKYIGQHVSLYTFMSALQNENSVLYKRRIKYGTLGETYYGVTCFTLTSYASGSNLGKFDNEIADVANGFNTQISPYEIEPGDMLILAYDRETVPDETYQHSIIIYDVVRDGQGRITHVQLAEAAPPFAVIHKRITFDNFMSGYINGGYRYKVYKATNRLDYGYYKMLDVVAGYSDEILPTVVYPDIMPEYGDKACIEAGTDVAINIIDSKAYTSIEVYKNGALIDTKNTIADFTIQDIQAGTYTFKLTDGTNTSESYLIAADVSGSYDSTTHRLTFASSNATPVFAASYETTGAYKGVQNKVKYFTADEIAQGYADVSEIVGAKYDAVQVGFLTEYGVAMWWSEKLTDEWEYWTPQTS